MDVGRSTLDTAFDALREAVQLGLLATVVFCAVTGVAVGLWAGVRWWIGLLAGALALYGGILVLLLVGAARATERARDARATRTAVPVGTVPPAVASPPTAPALAAPVDTVGGFRSGLRRGWRRWTRTPPTRGEWVAAVLALLVAAGLVAATQVTWLSVRVVGYGVTGFGPFAVQLGLFVVVSAVVAVVCAAGVLRWRSAWWPVLLAWFGTWWGFVAVEALRSDRALDTLNGLLRDQVRQRAGVDARPELDLGTGWTMMAVLAAAMLLLAVVLLVLQGRRQSHYRLVARS